MEKKISIKNLYLLLLISLGLVGLGVGSTYAMFITSAEISNPISFVSNLSYNSDILEPIQVTVPAGELISTTLNITNNNSSTLNYVTWYSSDDTTNLDVGVNSGTPTGTLVSAGNISIEVAMFNSSENNIVVTLGVSSSSDNVTIDDSMIPVPNEKVSVSLISYITKLYKDNVDNTPVETSSGTYYYAQDVRLMNDGLDVTGVSTNDINSGNLRYYGEDGDELKNYIYFNCDDYSDTTTCETWRILGVIDGKVKIMKNSPIERLSWDYNYNDDMVDESSDYDWNISSLMTLLNGPYYANEDTVYYNYDDSGSSEGGGGGGSWGADDEDNSITFAYSSVSSMFLSNDKIYPDISVKPLYYEIPVTLNFESDGFGITDITKTNNLISSSTWYINNVGIYPLPNDIYIEEQTGTNIWNGNIALADLSDYLFSKDLINAASSGWFDQISYQSWLLSSYYSIDGICYYEANSYDCMKKSYCDFPVVPVLYLDPELSFDLNTDGSSTNPYKLIVG